VSAIERVVEAAREFIDNVHEECLTDDGSRCEWCDAPWPCPTQVLSEAIAEWDEAVRS